MDICGHADIRKQLARIATQGIIPQSFLFSGPRQLGKFLVAQEFAEVLSGNSFSDGAHHADILIIGRPVEDATKDDESMKRRALSVDEIRQAGDFLSRFPTEGKYRVVIIDEADRLTPPAENALLKVLEEPNSTSIIILVTHRPAQLLPTVRSRLFPVSFRPLPAAELAQFFPAAKLPDFFFSLGLPGLVAEAARDTEEFEKKKDLLRGLFQLSRLSWAERIALAEKLANETEALPDILEIWLSGLSRKQVSQAMRSISFAAFLEAGLETLDHVTEKEGNPRLLLEKLFATA